MAAIVTFIGALISGFVGGVVAVEYRHRRDKNNEVRKWYNQTERLAQRVLRHDYNDWTGPKPLYARATCAGVHSELASHLGEAPPPIDEDVLSVADQLVSECQLVKQMRERDAERDTTEIQTRVTEAAEVAERLDQLARENRERIRF
ncbi:MAG: hypothetical protein PPP55_03620 [Halorubrum sp.]